MKTNLPKAFACAIAMTLFYNCSVEPTEEISLPSSSDIQILEVSATVTETELNAAICHGANPKSRFVNKGTVPFDYQIYDVATAALIAEFVDIMPGATTEWVEFPEGNLVFNFENEMGSDQKVAHLMENCKEISFEIDLNNSLLPASPQDSSN